MKHRLAWWAVLALVVSLAVPTALARGASPLPFRATAHLVSTTGLVSREACGPVEFGNFGRTDVYEGTATALGRFTLTQNLCLSRGRYDPVTQPSIPYASFATFVAANGDQLSYLEAGYLDTALGRSRSISFRFLYGTGRFAHPAGALTTEFVVDAQGRSLGLTQVGTLTYAPADRGGP